MVLVRAIEMLLDLLILLRIEWFSTAPYVGVRSV